jgi:hypothetical protein
MIEVLLLSPSWSPAETVAICEAALRGFHHEHGWVGVRPSCPRDGRPLDAAFFVGSGSEIRAKTRCEGCGSHVEWRHRRGPDEYRRWSEAEARRLADRFLGQGGGTATCPVENCGAPVAAGVIRGGGGGDRHYPACYRCGNPA